MLMKMEMEERVMSSISGDNTQMKKLKTSDVYSICLIKNTLVL
jgi:hypothetical protein